MAPLLSMVTYWAVNNRVEGELFSTKIYQLFLDDAYLMK